MQESAYKSEPTAWIMGTLVARPTLKSKVYCAHINPHPVPNRYFHSMIVNLIDKCTREPIPSLKKPHGQGKKSFCGVNTIENVDVFSIIVMQWELGTFQVDGRSSGACFVHLKT